MEILTRWVEAAAIVGECDMGLKWGMSCESLVAKEETNVMVARENAKEFAPVNQGGDIAIKMSAVIITPGCFMWRVLQTLGRNAWLVQQHNHPLWMRSMVRRMTPISCLGQRKKRSDDHHLQQHVK
ncbi:predicted protein [Lichtheimia corymbifera JMRC:FSU:9682]|uniref:Uncharacterized protein n=1 Tax=Lichtheimia corymbifera JMRC:FSU:9682 TaxID=1263082 RepID=A0A068RT72_9FUNG|nr:predicted protein [Lichtheimia corymbifera JMRC:FSU:9682]